MKEENQNGKERQMAEEQIDFRTLLFKYIRIILFNLYIVNTIIKVYNQSL